jgi:uncharacterized membrane protein YkoI
MKARILRPGVLLVACSLMLMSLCLPRTGAQETLPEAAATSVKALYPGGAITGIRVETDEGVTLYVVRLERGKLTTDVEVSGEGIIGEAETELGLDDVPEYVADAIREAMKGGTLVAVEKHELRGRVQDGRMVALTEPMVVYEVKFVLDGKNRIVEVADTPALKLPPAARLAVQMAFPAARVREASSEREGDLLLYEVRLDRDGLRIELDVSAEGIIASVETSAEAGDLPQAVAKAMARAAKGAEILRVDREEVRAVPRLVPLDRPRVLYEVAFIRDGEKHAVTIAADGTVVETEREDADAERDDP